MSIVECIRRRIKLHLHEKAVERSSISKSRYQDVEDYYESKSNYEKLVRLYARKLKQETQKNDDLAIAHHKMAVAFLNLGKWEEAGKHFEISMNLLGHAGETTVEVMDVKASNIYNLFLLFHEDEFARQAEDLIRKTILKFPDYEQIYDLYLILADIYLKLKRYAEAVSACEAALHLSKHEREKSFVYHLLASVYNNQQKYSEAIEYYQKSLESAGEERRFYSKIYYDIGKMYLDKGERQQGIAALKKALKFRKYSPWLRNAAEYAEEIRWLLKKENQQRL